MALPILILAGIMSVITAPGLIAQHLEARKAKAEGLNTEGAQNA